MSSIDYAKLYSDGLPDPAPKWAPFPPYYFVGGNNDPEQIPIEGLIDLADRAMYAAKAAGERRIAFFSAA